MKGMRRGEGRGGRGGGKGGRGEEEEGEEGGGEWSWGEEWRRRGGDHINNVLV